MDYQELLYSFRVKIKLFYTGSCGLVKATAYYVSDRIGVMLRGNLVEVGKAKEILDKPLHPYTQFLKQSILEPDPDKKKLDILQKQEISATEISEYQREGCKFSGRCPQVMDACREKEPGYYEPAENGIMVKCFLYESL
ncbi:MAG TPA: hypothetical protein PK016_08655 [Candidatus Atribacteria bacterium]|nr:hypothetical protein [Candidatus Atribacteria bacterium]